MENISNKQENLNKSEIVKGRQKEKEIIIIITTWDLKNLTQKWT